MTWLITGIDGFTGRHLWNMLKENSEEEVYGTSRLNSEEKKEKKIVRLDLTDENEINNVVTKICPSKIVLLAGLSSQRDSFKQKELYQKVNYLSTKYFLDAIQQNNLKTKVLMISSAMVYSPSEKKHKETDKVGTTSPYTETKLMQENLILQYPKIHVACARPFNLSGPGQGQEFVIPKIAKAFASARSKVELEAGDTSSVRDFLHVKDACTAYKIILEKGRKEIYNVCSSEGHTIATIVTLLEYHTGKKASLIKTSAYKNERPFLVGDNTKLRQLGWFPQIGFRQLVTETYEFYRNI